MARYEYVVSYKHPKRGRLINILVQFEDSDIEAGAFNTHLPEMQASRMAKVKAERDGILAKGYLEYGVSGTEVTK